MSDMLGVLRGDEIASIATWSGGYLSNQANVDILDSMIKSYVSWPPMEVTNNYSQIIISGGSNDQFGQSIMGYNIYIHFDQMAVNDTAWLNGRGHDLVTCGHTQGHTAPAGISPSLIINFFAAHPKGTTDSPYMNGLPVGWPTWCGVSPSN